MAFAQITWRESLRDIEACLAANQGKLFHMGMKAPPARSTLGDALNLRDWRIFHALAQRLIVRARALYAQEQSSSTEPTATEPLCFANRCRARPASICNEQRRSAKTE